MHIAIVGIDAFQNDHIAQKVRELTEYPIISAKDDAMLELLKLDAKKYFNAYQLHLLLDRCQQIEKHEDAILCDSLFTDICAVKAALQWKIINPLEADIYFSKHNEYNDFLMQSDLILFIESEQNILEHMVIQNERFKGDLSLNFYLECYELYHEKIDSLRLKLKDRFVDLAANDTEEILQSLFAKTDNVNFPEVVEETVTMAVQEEVNQSDKKVSLKDIFLSELGKKKAEISLLANKEEVQSLINDFEEGINLEHTRYASVDEDNIICLKQVLVDDELSIDCKVFASIEDAVSFLE